MDNPVSILSTLPTSDQIAPPMTAEALLFWFGAIVLLVVAAEVMLLKRHSHYPSGVALFGFAIVVLSNIALQGLPVWIGVALLIVGVLTLVASAVLGVRAAVRFLRSRQNERRS